MEGVQQSLRQKLLSKPIHTGAPILQAGNSFQPTKVLKDLEDLHWVPLIFPDKKTDAGFDWVWILDSLSKVGQTGLPGIHSGGETRFGEGQGLDFHPDPGCSAPYCL